MRLFLASQDFGRHADRLLEMVKNNRKVLFIDNAKDYKSEAEKQESLERKRKMFTDVGWKDFIYLDLRKYFGKKDELERFIETEKPGLIFAIGGNSFILRRAFAQSGLDGILLRDLAEDKYVYGGSSAGSEMVEKSFEGHEIGDDPDFVPEGYDAEVIWGGLGLISEMLLPHADQEWADYVPDRQKYFEERGLEYLLMGDSDVLVVDGDKKEVLR